MTNELQDFLRLPYGELEEMNLKAKEQRMKRVSVETIQEERLKYLTDEKRIRLSGRHCQSLSLSPRVECSFDVLYLPVPRRSAHRCRRQGSCRPAAYGQIPRC